MRNFITVALFILLASGCATIVRPTKLSKVGKSAADRVVVPGKEKLSDEEIQAALARIDAERDEAQCDLAIAAWKRDDRATARNIIEQVLARRPKQATARRLIADLKLEDGDAAGAERILRDILAENPDDEAAKLELKMLEELKD